MAIDPQEVADILDGLDTPTPDEVYHATKDYDTNYIVAAVGAKAYGPNGGSTPVTSPLDIDDCALWLDASTLALADDAAVATWPDGSGNGFDATQATANLKPVCKTNVVNGLRVVRFTQSPDIQHLALSGDGLGLFRNLGGCTIAAVAANPTDNNTYYVLTASAAADNTLRRAGLEYHGDGVAVIGGCNDDSGSDAKLASRVFGTTGANKMRRAAIAGSLAFTAGAVTVDATMTVQKAVGIVNSGGTTAALPDTDSLAVVVGAFSDLSAGSSCDYCEIVAYSRALNARERRELLEYLSAKWATL